MPKKKNATPPASTPRSSGRSRAYLLVGIILFALVVVGVWWTWGRGAAPMPPLIYETGEEGVDVARLDKPRLTEWCRANDLPDPPGIGALEPAVAERLAEAIQLAGEEHTGDAYGAAAQIFESLDSHGTAAAYFRLAEAADPANFRWPYHLGCIHQEAGDGDAAIEVLERALGVNPEYAVTLARLGQLYLEAGQPDRSREMFERYSAARPDDWLGSVGLGRVALERGELEEALEHLEAAARLQTEDFQVQYNLGRVHAALGQREQAQQHFANAASLPQGAWFAARDPLVQDLQRSGQSAASLVTEFERLSETQDWPKLASLAEEIIRRRPNDTSMMANLASIYRKMDRKDEARELVQRGLAMRPDSLRLRIVLSEILLSQHEYPQAVEAADQALTLEPGQPRALVVRGRALYQSKRYEEAEVTLRQYCRLVPEDVVSFYMLGEAILALGREEEAISVFEEVLERQPGFKYAKARLEYLARQEG